MTLAAARHARQRAAQEIPAPAALAALAAGAAQAADMSPGQIRRLAADAISQAQQISFLLGRLAELTDTPAGEP